MCDAVETALAAATGLTYTQSYDELSEGMANVPTLQVYWDHDEEASVGGDTEVITFGGNTAQVYVLHLDLYAARRSQLKTDMQTVHDLVDACDAVIYAQAAASPPFGVSRVQYFQWTWERALFEYASASYMGARCTLSVGVY